MKTDDLGALDRTTLWFWRASNLAGWGLSGTVAAGVTGFLSGRLIGGLSGVVYGLPSFVLVLVALAFVALSGAAAGIIVGNHVYRSPRLVGALALLLPSLAWVVLAVPDAGWQEVGISVGFPAIGAVVSALFAGHRFDKRPRALRANAA